MAIPSAPVPWFPSPRTDALQNAHLRPTPGPAACDYHTMDWVLTRQAQTVYLILPGIM